jgi:hypothetical protein
MTVLAQLQIGLDGGHANIQSHLEGRQRIAGLKSASTAMAL